MKFNLKTRLMKIIHKEDSLIWHPAKRWKTRKIKDIEEIIIHQEMGTSNIEAVNRYHIGKNHISPTGCPHFCYHFGIEENGEIIQANHLTDITWGASGRNKGAIHIMLVGNFKGVNYAGKSEFKQPQKDSLAWLLNALKQYTTKISFHSDYGKPACPGYQIEAFINMYKMNYL